MSAKILIVDDNAELREALLDQLALHEEFESIGVETGARGVQAAKAGEIDLVIMDVGLPDIDGREAAIPAASRTSPSVFLFATQVSRHQFVAAGLGDQNSRAAGILFDLLPQPANVGFERVGG
jgi:DNA-binding response OmpR family regulator